MKPSPDPPAEGPDTPAARLYQRHAVSVLVYLRMHVTTPEDAEDLLAEVFLAAFERATLLTFSEGEQQAWLQRVAHHKVVDYYRRSARRTTLTIDQVAEVLQEDEACSPEQATILEEERRQLRAAIKGLPAIHQEVLRLRFRDGLHTPQIAALLGKREGAIQKLLYRTIARLRTRYANQQEGVGSHAAQ
jgi:RNA polymerase sigma factor (sigma-70 family)